MKATSKLISVVLILAMCLSLFTVSAFAAPGQTVIIGGGMIDSDQTGGVPAANSWVGANRGTDAAVIEGDSYQGSGADEPVTEADAAQAVPGTADQVTNTVPAVVTVSTAAELAAVSAAELAAASTAELAAASVAELAADSTFSAVELAAASAAELAAAAEEALPSSFFPPHAARLNASMPVNARTSTFFI